jgi:hypothetical protein
MVSESCLKYRRRHRLKYFPSQTVQVQLGRSLIHASGLDVVQDGGDLVVDDLIAKRGGFLEEGGVHGILLY